MKQDIAILREQIDAIDRELITLLEKRLDVAADIAAHKQTHGLPVLDASREAQKLAAVRAQCRPETAENIADVFKSVMTAARRYQETLMEAEHGG